LIASLFWLKLLAHKTRGSAAAAVGKIKKEKRRRATHIYIALFMVPPPPCPSSLAGPSRRATAAVPTHTHTHIYKQRREKKQRSRQLRKRRESRFSQWFLIPRRVSFRQEKPRTITPIVRPVSLLMAMDTAELNFLKQSMELLGTRLS
jgi:hypothetical protein